MNIIEGYLFYGLLFAVIVSVSALILFIRDKRIESKRIQYVTLTRKVILYYGLCGWRVDTIHVPVNDYFELKHLFDKDGFNINKCTVECAIVGNECKYKVVNDE